MWYGISITFKWCNFLNFESPIERSMNYCYHDKRLHLLGFWISLWYGISVVFSWILKGCITMNWFNFLPRLYQWKVPVVIKISRYTVLYCCSFDKGIWSGYCGIRLGSALEEIWKYRHILWTKIKPKNTPILFWCHINQPQHEGIQTSNEASGNTRSPICIINQSE